MLVGARGASREYVHVTLLHQSRNPKRILRWNELRNFHLRRRHHVHRCLEARAPAPSFQTHNPSCGRSIVARRPSRCHTLASRIKLPVAKYQEWEKIHAPRRQCESESKKIIFKALFRSNGWIRNFIMY